MSAAPSRRAHRLAYAAGLIAAALVLGLGAGISWPFERELFWIRGTAWCALIGLALTLSVSPLGRALVRRKRTRRPLVDRVRRALGITTAALATLHAGLGVATYLRESWPLLLDVPWIRSGVLAWALLSLLWITSYPALVKRARVKLWKPLHRLAYVAFGLAIHHALLSPFAPKAWVLGVGAGVVAVAALRWLR